MEKYIQLNECTDYYGERLKVGDKVIPIIRDVPVYFNSGYISSIKCIKNKKNALITLVDDKNNVIVSDDRAKNYATQEVYDLYENNNFIYNLVFYDQTFHTISLLPLTDNTDINFEIPKGTCFVTLNAKYLEKIDGNIKKYIYDCLYHLIVINPNLFVDRPKIEIIHSKGKNNYYKEDYLLVKENYLTYKTHKIDSEYIVMKSNNELQQCISKIIKLFHRTNAFNIYNGNIPINENEKGKVFQKTLVNKINKQV